MTSTRSPAVVMWSFIVLPLVSLHAVRSLLVFGDQGLVKELPVFKRLIDFIVAQLPKQLANHKK